MSFEIVKPAVDVGIQTNAYDDHASFWGSRLGLRYDHLLKVGGGVHQHRYDLHGAVLKLNSARDPLPADAPTGFRGLATVGDEDVGGSHTAPDGIPVAVAAELGDAGLRTVVTVEVTNSAVTTAALVAGLGATPDGGDGVRIGETGFALREVPDRAPTRGRDGTGIRYLTIQVRDVVAAHAHALANGLTEGLAPVQLGEVAYISFVRLPDGDWIELSQRASLTGPLPGRPG